MEENNNEQIEKHVCFKNHCWKMCVGMVLAAFLGGFLATYFVVDQIMERSMRKHFMPPQRFERTMFNDFDREITRDIKHFDKMFNKKDKLSKFSKDEFDMQPLFMPEPVKIKSEYENGNYDIKIGLKPFQYDESKINYNIIGKKLTVYGSSFVKDKNNEQEISFSHDFLLPENADTINIQKIKDGKDLIISVPIKE